MDAWVLRSEVGAGGNYFYPAFRGRSRIAGYFEFREPGSSGWRSPFTAVQSHLRRSDASYS